jgi:hypothetical protein
MAAVSTSGTLGSIPQNPATASPASSVEELGEEEELNNTTTDSQWEKPESQGDTKLPPRPPVPLQKRRRVTRACDECRRKKIKCDGAVHCNHCQVCDHRKFGLLMLTIIRFMDMVQTPQQ